MREELVGHVPVHQRPGLRQADLPGQAEGDRAHGDGRGGGHVRVGEHQRRALAAQLEADPLEAAGRASMIFRPTARLPVNESLSTIGWLISASPVGSPGPVTTFSTPAGSPASSISWASRSTANVAYSDGLSTTVQPAARAGAIFCAASRIGAFHGTTAPDHADGLAQRHHHVVATLERRQRLAGQLVHPPGVMIEDIGHERRRRRVHGAEAQRHAVVQRLQREQLVAVLADQVGDPAQQPDPLVSPQPRPGPLVEGPPRRADGQVDVVRPGDRERGHLLAGGRVTVAPRLARTGPGPHCPSISREPSVRPPRPGAA